MDLGLNDEQRLIVETVRDFVEKELYPHEDLVERLDEVPGELARSIRGKALAAGLYAANMPAELGGGGLDAVSMVLVERELGRASYALQMLVGRPSNILQACLGEQRDRYLGPAIRGERHDCVAMTEPGAGSDVRSMTTTARRDGDAYIVNGTKHFISHADVADFIILFAAAGRGEAGSGRGEAGSPQGEAGTAPGEAGTAPGEAGTAPGEAVTARGGARSARRPRKPITALLVDADSSGLTVRRGPGCVSNRGYHQCELVFTDCRVPAANRLGEEGRGLELMGSWLGASRLTVAATSVGRARRALEAATEWAARRQQFGQPIGHFQGVGFRLADMATEVEAAELLTLRAAARLDQGMMTDADVAMAKVYATEVLGRVTDAAVQIFGGMGLMNELPVERWWRDARVERIWDGTSEIQRHIIARSLLRPLGA